MPRVEGWERLLWEAVEAVRAKPFAWGSHDCATWASDMRCLLTGLDAASEWRGTYRSKAGAMRAMRRVCGTNDPVDAATAFLGTPLATPLLAQRGDVVLQGRAFGICLGADCAFLAPEGLSFLPITEIESAWRV